nr:putative reverse transcriptase domain-containing protein [Tanacetum cinerariifolium]
MAFQILKQKHYEAPILALPEGNDDFVIYCDASIQAQAEALKEKNVQAENLQGMEKAFELRTDGTHCIKNRSWLPLFGIASSMVNGKIDYELKGKFLDDLRYNAFSGTNEENAEAGNDDEQETTEIFRIETNLFDYEIPLCIKFKEFNFLHKVDPKLFTHDNERTKTYEDYENELNDELEKLWSEDGVPYEIYDHICEPFRFKNGKAKWSA